MPKTFKKVQQGFTIIELLIVIAIIGILAGLVLNNFQGAQAKARDVQRKTRINSIHSKLEEYYNNNGGYPDGVLSNTVLAGIDAAALTDTNGAAISQQYTLFGGGASPAAPAAVTNNKTTQMWYQAYGCTSAAAVSPVGSSCTKYILSTWQEAPGATSPYVKNSLN